MVELEERDLRAARNMIDFCDVRPGDNVLVLKDHVTHHIVERATEIAAEEKGGHVTILEARHPAVTYGFGQGKLPREYQPMHEALKGADVVIQLGIGIRMAGIDEILANYGITYCMCDGKTLEIFRSDYFLFPYQLTSFIGEKFYNKMKGGKRQIHMTAPSGTDYTGVTDVDRFGVSGGMSDLLCGKLRRPGDWSFFPSGNLGLCVVPDEPTNGVFVADMLPPFACPSAMRDPLLKAAKEVTRFIIKDHWVADGPLIPGNPVGGTATAIEDGALWRYTGIVQLYKCKTDQTDLLRSYSISRTMNGRRNSLQNDNIRPFRLWSAITRPSTKLVFMDASSEEGWLNGSFSPVEDIEAQNPVWFRRDSLNITARHNGGCNLVLADMHYEYWRFKDRRTVRLAEWQLTPAEASDDNPDLERMIELLKGKNQ